MKLVIIIVLFVIHKCLSNIKRSEHKFRDKNGYATFWRTIPNKINQFTLNEDKLDKMNLDPVHCNR